MRYARAKHRSAGTLPQTVKEDILAVNRQIPTSYSQQDSLAFALAGILGVPVADVSDMLARATQAAIQADFATCPGCDQCSPRTDPEGFEHPGSSVRIGFHVTTIVFSRPGALDGTWQLRCASAIQVDRDSGVPSNGAAELSLGDLRILLRFEYDLIYPLKRWTGIYRVWAGAPYDPAAEDVHH